MRGSNLYVGKMSVLVFVAAKVVPLNSVLDKELI